MKVFRNVMILVLAMAMLVPTMAFADEATEGRPTERSEERVEKVKASIEDAITEYLPSRLDEWLAGKADHENVHVALEAMKEEQKLLNDARRAEIKETLMALKESLKAQLENEEITREEAKAIIEEAKLPYQADKEFFTSIRTQAESLRAEKEINKNSRVALRESIKVMIQNEEDPSAIAAALSQLIDLQLQHLHYDYSGLDLRTQVVNYLQ